MIKIFTNLLQNFMKNSMEKIKNKKYFLVEFQGTYMEYYWTIIKLFDKTFCSGN